MPDLVRSRGLGNVYKSQSILCGNGGMYLHEEMLRGADGAMTGFGYPEMMAQVIEANKSDETLPLIHT